MEFFETPGGRLGLRDIPSILAELLRLVPSAAECDLEKVEQRIFPSPSPGADGGEVCEDWKAHVEPELHSLFQNSRQVVEADLRGMKETDGVFALEFSRGHAEAWANALNQARIVLVTRHNIGDREMSEPFPLEIQTERDFALLQIYFYGEVLQWLVEVLDA